MAINLSKSGDQHKIDLTKKRMNQIQIHANLNWSQQINSGGFFKKIIGSISPADLDLGCMVEMMNGNKLVIQPIGDYFGAKDDVPFIYLDKDDRTGDAQDGENMYILKPELIKRVLFFALIYAGAKNFKSVGAHMSFAITNGETVSLELNNPDGNSTFCAAAMFLNNNGELILRKEEQYFKGHPMADDFYHFGFQWFKGSK